MERFSRGKEPHTSCCIYTLSFNFSMVTLVARECIIHIHKLGQLESTYNLGHVQKICISKLMTEPDIHNLVQFDVL